MFGEQVSNAEVAVRKPHIFAINILQRAVVPLGDIVWKGLQLEEMFWFDVAGLPQPCHCGLGSCGLVEGHRWAVENKVSHTVGGCVPVRVISRYGTESLFVQLRRVQCPTTKSRG